MKNPYELPVLYRKDDIAECLTARQMTISDFDMYEITIDLEEVASIEASLVDEKEISILVTKSGHLHNIKMPYPKLKNLIISQCGNYSEMVNLKRKQ